MATTFKWVVSQLDTAPSEDCLTDVVNPPIINLPLPWEK